MRQPSKLDFLNSDGCVLDLSIFTTFCRRQTQLCSNEGVSFFNVRRHCKKSRILYLSDGSPIPTIILKVCLERNKIHSFSLPYVSVSLVGADKDQTVQNT